MSRILAEIDPKNPEIVRIGTVVFDLAAKELRDRHGNRVDLRSQSAEVLAQLARRPGRVVAKGDLISAVWPDTFVTDDSLVQCVADIRRALGDDGHRLILTLPRKGYRLVPTPEAAGFMPGPTGRRTTIISAVLVALLALVGVYAWLFQQIGNDGDDRPVIAVLPFEDHSSGADKGYLSDAIAEGLITELARSRTYAVVARNSSFKYRGQATDVREIGRDLGVDYVLEGSQQKVGDRLQVNAQLIDARTGHHLWANLYDRGIGDLFVVQDEIVRTLADRVGARIERPLPVTSAARVSALHYYLLGIAEVRANFSEDGVAAMRRLALRAVASDPNSPFGHINLAWASRHDAVFGWNGADRDAALIEAEGFADKAIALDPENSEAHYIRARLHEERGEWEQAIQRFDRAIELNPSDSNVLNATSSPLLYVGRTDEAIARIRQAMGVDPFHPDHFHWQMSWALWEKGDCDGAVREMQRMAPIPDPAQRMLAAALSCAGRSEAAREALAIFLKTSNHASLQGERERLAPLWAASGSLDRWIEDLRQAGMPE
jgi:TolB-like protein/DNA-binding winged helix-turn-helix (wHTH) protein